MSISKRLHGQHGTKCPHQFWHVKSSEFFFFYFFIVLFLNDITFFEFQAKLPRGIKNIRPHLENVDNVPLLVSLFTDCSAEATREMIMIMQNYGEIVVCIGSSAGSANVDIFLQADCGIAIEPLYPQVRHICRFVKLIEFCYVINNHLFYFFLKVCQSIAAYTESNLLNNRSTLNVQQKPESSNESDKNKSWFEYEPTRFHRSSTISPIYISRQLNAIPCSVSICRDDTFLILGMIELSRRFTNGLWNCIQVKELLPQYKSKTDILNVIFFFYSFGCAVAQC